MTEAAKKLGNEPAFPCFQGKDAQTCDPGLTKREWLAGMAMQSIIQVGTAGGATRDDAAKSLGIKVEDYNSDVHYPMLIARDAMIQADALLEQLARTQ